MQEVRRCRCNRSRQSRRLNHVSCPSNRASGRQAEAFPGISQADRPCTAPSASLPPFFGDCQGFRAGLDCRHVWHPAEQRRRGASTTPVERRAARESTARAGGDSMATEDGEPDGYWARRLPRRRMLRGTAVVGLGGAA